MEQTSDSMDAVLDAVVSGGACVGEVAKLQGILQPK